MPKQFVPKMTFAFLVVSSILFTFRPVAADWTIQFDSNDFGKTPVFSTVTNFAFEIVVAGDLVSGTYNNPTLTSVVYSVNGTLAPGTPSGFPAFALQRTITGADFYSQMSSLNFQIVGGANLADGLQFGELVGTTSAFQFNGREVDTGRYHPAIVDLNSDGTGRIQNSNNMGGINPSSGQIVNVTIGQEYITDLTFNASTFTIGQANAVPEPSGVVITGLCLGMFLSHRQRNRI